MGIEAKIIADSVNPNGHRLITYVIKYNRFIIAEINTHRTLSKSSASSRAQPIHKMIKNIREECGIPVEWGKTMKGMSSDELISEDEQILAIKEWKSAMENSIKHAENIEKLKVHKQIVNRLIEPYSYTTTILSGTEWGNFFNLRASKESQPEFRELAYKMLEEYVNHKPNKLNFGEWHIPFVDQYIDENLSLENKLKIASARCARVSYLNFEGNIDHQKDYELHDKLLESGHMSPFEHCAKASTDNYISEFTGNFRGFIQYRKTLPNENRQLFDPVKLLSERNKNAQTKNNMA